MPMRIISTRTVLFLTLAVLACGSAGAIEWQSVDADTFINWQHNAEIGSGEERKLPDTLRLNAGAAFYGRFNNQPQGFYFRPGALFSWGKEEAYEGVARVSGEERPDAWNTLGFMLDSHFGYAWKTEKIEIGFQLGPSLNLRFPLYGGRGNRTDTWKAFYGKGEFLYAGAMLWAGFPLSEKISVLFGGRVYYPLSNIWTNAPALHGMKAGVNISLRFGLNRPDPANP